MPCRTPLELLLLTNFSAACFHASRAVAQLADDLDLRLSILHAYDPRREDRRAAEEKLHSFFPEADRFRTCNRLLAEGDVIDAVAQLQSSQRVDMVIAPVPDRVRLPQLIHRSIRLRLLAECGLSVFTMGRRADLRRLGSPPRNIACWLDFQSPKSHHLKLACSYAETVGARLHLLHVLPDINEGSILPPSQPLHQQEVAEAVRSRIGTRSLSPEIHVSPSNSAAALTRLVRRCDADLLFISEAQAIDSGLFGSSPSAVVQQAPCPTLCVSDRAGSLRLKPGPAHLPYLRQLANSATAFSD